MSGSGEVSRRRFVVLAGGSAAAVGLGACSAEDAADEATAGTGPATEVTNVAASVPVAIPASGARQAGIETPAPAQPNLLTVVYDLTGDPASTLAAIGRAVLALTTGRDAHLGGMSPADLTVTVGVGPRLVPKRTPGAEKLPAFPREKLRSGNGDVMVQFCATDPLLLPGAAEAITAAAKGALKESWRQHAFRGPNLPLGEGTFAPRNLLGFVDGIVNPFSAEQFEKDVWLSGPGTVAGGTIAVVRRMEIEVDRFLGLTTSAQEAIVGRRRDSAVPLSGGDPASNVDLGAKTPEGVYLVPVDAHARRAHPLATGVPTMFRRSYSFTDSTSSGRASGLLFVSFQNQLSTFVKTLNRMSTMDALLDFTMTTRSGTFLVLPGFGEERPLGAPLFS